MTYSNLPLFLQPWRWDAAFGESGWNAASVIRDGVLAGYWPYRFERKGPFRVVLQQPLFYYGGPWLNPELFPEREEAALSHQEKLLGELWAQLPSYHLLRHHGNPAQQYWLPLHRKGFRAIPRTSYVLDLLQSEEKIWNGLKSETRTRIRKAEKQIQVTTDGSFEDLITLLEAVYRRQGTKAPYTRDLVARLDTAQLQHHARTLLFAQTENGQAAAALYVVHDSTTGYLHLEGQNPDLRDSAAGALLLWHMILAMKEKGLQTFDFEGSMLPNVERNYRSFGATPITYYEWVHARHPILRLWTGWKMLG